LADLRRLEHRQTIKHQIISDVLWCEVDKTSSVTGRYRSDGFAGVRPREIGPVASGFAHPSPRRCRVDHAIRQIICPEAAGGGAYGLHLGVRGRIAVDDEPAWRLANDVLAFYHDGAERLVAAFERALAHFSRANHELGGIRRGWLSDWPGVVATATGKLT
jgi:hypothetical protein